MDQANGEAQGGNQLTLAKKSWTAYIGLLFVALIFFFMIVPAVGVSAPIWITTAIVLVGCSLLIYKFMSIKSVSLYLDDNGIWVYSGILPWNKGIQGVKWRDLDEAVYFQGMRSWLFKSYTLRIGHRFTKSSEIILSHMQRGNDAVYKINDRHQQLIKTNLLQ